MTDKVTKMVRSKTMSHIRSDGNKSTELRLRLALVRYGIKGWRMRNNNIIGKPDFIFEKQKIAIFADGCFWHGCPLCYREPSSSIDYWREKIRKNKERDISVTKALESNGWIVIRVWEHELKYPDKSIELINKHLLP